MAMHPASVVPLSAVIPPSIAVATQVPERHVPLDTMVVEHVVPSPTFKPDGTQVETPGPMHTVVYTRHGSSGADMHTTPRFGQSHASQPLLESRSRSR